MGRHLTEITMRLRELAMGKAGRLSSLREMAQAWNSSLATLQRAVAIGVAEGWLESRRGAGVWPAGRLQRQEQLPDRMDAATLADHLEQELREGRYRFGQALPSPKELGRRHGLHPATVRKSLGLLQGRRLVERQGRSWTVVRPSVRTAHQTPVLLCLGSPDPQGRLRLESDREWDFWRDLQAEAIHCGLVPRIHAWNGSLPRSEAPVLGAIVSTWHLPDSIPVLDALQRAKIPAAVWIVNEDLLPGPRYQRSRGLWFHDLANGEGAGATMGQYVSTLGHRSIAWINPFQGSSWARNRLAGLEAALSKDTPIHLATGSWISEWDIQVEVDADPLIRARMDLSGLDLEQESMRLRRPLVEAITYQRAMERFGPCLQEALDSGATLWVAASDLVASWCLRWLRNRGLHVPRDLALASFDDTRLASQEDLTSLRFEVQGMARAMVRQILSRKTVHSLVTRYTGQVMERGSSGPRPRPGG